MTRTQPLLLAAVAFALGLAAPALAADPPNTVSPSVGFDGNVNDVAVSGPTAFLAGRFKSAGENVGGLMLGDAASGARLPALPPIDGVVDAILPDGAGGWFIAGSWNQIGGVRVSGSVAHLLPDGSLAPGFSAPVFNEDVRSLALFSGRLVVGGGFTCIGGDGDSTCGGLTEPVGEVRQRALTALSPATGAAEPAFFDGGDTGINGSVNALATTAAALLVGGSFTCARGDGDQTCGEVGETVRRSLAAYSTTGVLSTWSPEVYRDPSQGVIYALEVAGTQVIAGGRFSCVAATMVLPNASCADPGEVVRHNVAAFQLPGAGDAALSYAPQPNSNVFALDATATRVYLGGSFDCVKSDGDNTCGEVGEVTRSGIAATSLDGTLESFDPRLDNGSVDAILQSPDGVYVSGFFACTQTDAQPRCDDPGELARRNAAAFDPVSGATLAWNPSLGNSASALARVGSGPIAIGGGMQIAAAVPRVGLAAVDLRTGALLPWDPMAGQDEDKYSIETVALSPDGRTVYAGGSKWVCLGYDGDFDCTDPGESSIGSFFAADAASGAIAPTFAPRPPEGPEAIAVGPDGTVYGSGVQCFGDTDGDCDDPTDVQRPRGLAAVNPAGTPLPWAPAPNSGTWELAVAGGAVYAVGNFTCVGGTDATCGNEPALEQPRLRAAAFDPVSGGLLAWNPAASVGTSTPAGSSVRAVEPDLARGRVLIAGNFTCLQTSTADDDCTDAGEVTRRSVAAVDAVSGVAQAWGPGSLTGLPTTPGEEAPALALALTADRETVLFAGAVATLEGQSRGLFGSLSASSGAGAAWNPGGGPSFAYLETAPGVAIAYGGFGSAGGSVREGLALFGAHPPVPPPVAPLTVGDVTRPVISGLRVGRRFRLGRGLVRVAAAKPKVPVGTTVRFTLSEDARVRLTVARKLAGRRSGKRCVAPAKARRGAKRCVRTVAVKGSASVAGRKGGNRVAFAGRLSRTVTLKPGDYLLSVVATDAAGNRSAPRSAAFALTRAARAKRR